MTTKSPSRPAELKMRFISSHRFSPIQAADSIAVLENRTIAETGAHSDLLQKSGRIYQLLYADKYKKAQIPSPFS
jgi:ABC-type transport system involved in Fe-S cluster assembly fused permease/ATPase subunit